MGNSPDALRWHFANDKFVWFSHPLSMMQISDLMRSEISIRYSVN